MKTFNIRTFIAFLCIAAMSFASCSKKKDAAPPSPMQGTWVGKWGYGNNEPSEYVSFIVKSNGTLKVETEDGDDLSLGTGKWSLNESTFKVVYYYNNNPGVKFNVVAKVNDAKTEISGSWGDGEEDPDSGTMILAKQ